MYNRRREKNNSTRIRMPRVFLNKPILQRSRLSLTNERVLQTLRKPEVNRKRKRKSNVDNCIQIFYSKWGT